MDIEVYKRALNFTTHSFYVLKQQKVITYILCWYVD